MSKKEKMTKDTVPEGFSLGLAIYDALPVLFFGVAVILLGVALESWSFTIGAILCLWAGVTKVIWKIIVVLKKKNIWWMFMQMRICMPIGFITMIVAVIVRKNNHKTSALLNAATSCPISIFFIVGFAGLVLMGVAAAILDSADSKSNWIEQTINTVAQLSILIGAILLAVM